MFFHETADRIIRFSQNEEPGPMHIHLDLTNRCNLKCLFCWQRSHERKGILDLSNELPDEKLLCAVDSAYKMGVRDWLISGGGEPMVRTELCMQIMEKIKALGMWGDIITNGTILGEERAKKIVEIGWDVFRVSLNGAHAQEHDRLVNKKGTFDIVVNNIKLINKYKRKYHSEKPQIGFNTVINVYSYRRFADIIKLLHRLGGTMMNVQTIILYDEEEKKYTLTPEQQIEFKSQIQRALKLANKYGIETNIGGYLDEGILRHSNELGEMDKVFPLKHSGIANAHCYEPFYLMCIRANGIVGSCRLFGDKGMSLHTHSLSDIWFSDYFRKTRKAIINGEMPDYCRYCGANEVIDNRKIREIIKEKLTSRPSNYDT